MKVLVTGATGFIGNYVVQELLKQKHTVIATSTSIEKAKKKKWHNQVKYIPFSFKEFDNNINYFQFFNEPDCLIHLAWQGLPNYNESFHVEENLPQHYNFLSNIVSNGLTNINITGTCFEYGMKEGCLDESMESKPANAYATAKDELRKKVEQLITKNQFSFKWIRLFYMYGKEQNEKSLFSQLEAALENGDEFFNMSGGEQVRDFLPVDRVAEYIVAISMQNKITGIINCCSGNPIAVKDFVLTYLVGLNKTIKLNLGYYPYTNYEPMSFWGDDKKLKKLIK